MPIGGIMLSKDSKLINPFIVPKKLFFDFVQLNYAMPTQKLSLITYTEESIHSLNNQNPHNKSREFLKLVKNNLVTRFKKTPGMRFYIDGMHHNLKIYFDSKFFINTDYISNIIQVHNTYLEIQLVFESTWFLINEWKNITPPIPTVAQIHLSFNSLFKSHPNRLQQWTGISPKQTHNNDNVFQQWIFSPDKQLNGYHLFFDDHLVQGVAGGSKKNVYLTAYDKSREPLPKLQMSLERFGTFDYIRREWKVYSRKLRSLNITTIQHLYDSVTDSNTFTEIFKRIRLSADILLSDDSFTYKIFHDGNDNNINLLRDSVSKKLSKGEILLINKRTHLFKNKIPKSFIKDTFWKPAPHLIGILDNHADKMDTNDYLKIIDKLKEIIYSKDKSINNGHTEHIDIKRIKTHWLNI